MGFEGDVTLAPHGSVLLIGHSYVAAIDEAWRARGDGAFPLRTVSFVGRFQRLSETVNGEARLGPEVARSFADALAETKPALVVAALWGNQHFPLSTVNNPRPFDFILPGDPPAPLENGAELVPFDLIERFLYAEFADARLMAAALRALSPAPLLLLPAPPPLRDFAGLPRGAADRTVDAEVARYGVAPSSLRRKVWRVCEAIYGSLAAQAGAAVAPTPPGVADADGFRRREFYSQDWIHANAGWGELVLRQIEAEIAR